MRETWMNEWAKAFNVLEKHANTLLFVMHGSAWHGSRVRSQKLSVSTSPTSQQHIVKEMVCVYTMISCWTQNSMYSNQQHGHYWLSHLLLLASSIELVYLTWFYFICEEISFRFRTNAQSLCRFFLCFISLWSVSCSQDLILFKVTCAIHISNKNEEKHGENLSEAFMPPSPHSGERLSGSKHSTWMLEEEVKWDWK